MLHRVLQHLIRPYMQQFSIRGEGAGLVAVVSELVQ
jgi:hypothetical protein